MDIHELVEKKLPSLEKHHLQFLTSQTPYLAIAIKNSHTRAFLSGLYLKYVNIFPEQQLTLSTMKPLDKIKMLENHVYVNDCFQLICALTLNSCWVVWYWSLWMTRFWIQSKSPGMRLLSTSVACAMWRSLSLGTWGNGLRNATLKTRQSIIE